MSENIEIAAEVDPAAEVKQLHDLNLKALADDLAQVLSNHVGGTFEADLTKLEHTHLGFLDDRLILNFSIKDESHFERYQLTKEGGFFSRIKD